MPPRKASPAPATRDRLTPEERSRNMARIRSHNTKPEKTVRHLVTALGLRYRLHRRDLPGKPDLVFGPRRTVLFVHGCFWHQHANCRAGRMPTAHRPPRLLDHQTDPQYRTRCRNQTRPATTRLACPHRLGMRNQTPRKTAAPPRPPAPALTRCLIPQGWHGRPKVAWVCADHPCALPRPPKIRISTAAEILKEHGKEFHDVQGCLHYQIIAIDDARELGIMPLAAREK